MPEDVGYPPGSRKPLVKTQPLPARRPSMTGKGRKKPKMRPLPGQSAEGLRARMVK